MLFNELFGRQFDHDFVMHGSEIDTEFKLANCMQPDFLFVSTAETVSIEMKVKAKSSVDQVRKYALLGLAVEIKQNVEMEHHLVLLGSGAFAGMFKERFESEDKLITNIIDKDLTAFLLNKPALFRERKERLNQIVKQMHVKFINYKDFARFLGEAAPPQIDQSPGAEVYRKLIFGLVKEFQQHSVA